MCSFSDQQPQLRSQSTASITWKKQEGSCLQMIPAVWSLQLACGWGRLGIFYVYACVCMCVYRLGIFYVYACVCMCVCMCVYVCVHVCICVKCVCVSVGGWVGAWVWGGCAGVCVCVVQGCGVCTYWCGVLYMRPRTLQDRDKASFPSPVQILELQTYEYRKLVVCC